MNFNPVLGERVPGKMRKLYYKGITQLEIEKLDSILRRIMKT